MQESISYKQHNKVDYYPLLNGYADVFLHKDEITELDAEGNTIYIAKEIYFKIEQTTTKEKIEENFDYMWDNTETIKATEPTDKERIANLETLILQLSGVI